jgi:hypothetical protein
MLRRTAPPAHDPRPDAIELCRLAVEGLALPPISLERWLDRLEGRS